MCKAPPPKPPPPTPKKTKNASACAPGSDECHDAQRLPANADIKVGGAHVDGGVLPLVGFLRQACMASKKLPFLGRGKTRIDNHANNTRCGGNQQSVVVKWVYQEPHHLIPIRLLATAAPSDQAGK